MNYLTENSEYLNTNFSISYTLTRKKVFLIKEGEFLTVKLTFSPNFGTLYIIMDDYLGSRVDFPFNKLTKERLESFINLIKF